MNSALNQPAPKGFALPTNEEDRKKWTERLDQELPHYKQSKSEIGRILKELKAVYCRPGCQGLWKPFLQSRGLAVSTANDLIARYVQESCVHRDSPQSEEATSRDLQTPSKSMQMKLTIPPEYRDEFKQAVDRLGRDNASVVIFHAVVRAVAEADMAARIAEDPSAEPEFATHSPNEHAATSDGDGNLIRGNVPEHASTNGDFENNYFEYNADESGAGNNQGNSQGNNQRNNQSNNQGLEHRGAPTQAAEQEAQLSPEYTGTAIHDDIEPRTDGKTEASRNIEDGSMGQERHERPALEQLEYGKGYSYTWGKTDP